MEVHVSDLSNSLPVDVAPKKLSAFTEEVLRQRKSTDRGKDQYKLVKKNVYFYEFAKSVACSAVKFPNVYVQNLAFNSSVGDGLISDSYCPCMKVVSLSECQYYQQQLQQQYLQQLSRMQGILETCENVSQAEAHLSHVLNLCKTALSNTIVTCAPVPSAVYANELVINEHFGNWLSKVKPQDIFLYVNEASCTNFSAFNASKEDFILFSNSSAGVIMSDSVEFNEWASFAGLFGASIECKMDSTFDVQDQIIAEMHNVAAEVGRRLVTGNVVFNNITVFGLVVSYTREKAMIYKLHLDFENSRVNIWKSDRGTHSITEGVKYLFGALL